MSQAIPRIGYYLAAASEGSLASGIALYTWRLAEVLLESFIPVDFHLFISSSQREEVERFRRVYPHRKVTYI